MTFRQHCRILNIVMPLISIPFLMIAGNWLAAIWAGLAFWWSLGFNLQNWENHD